MKHDRKHLDEFFREKFANYKEPLPPEAWEELEARMAAPAAPVAGPVRWFWHSAIIAALLILGVTVWKHTGNTGTVSEESAITQATEANGTNGATGNNTAAKPAQAAAIAAPDENAAHDGNKEPNAVAQAQTQTENEATVARATNEHGMNSPTARRRGSSATTKAAHRGGRKTEQPGRGMRQAGSDAYTGIKPEESMTYNEAPGTVATAQPGNPTEASPDQTLPGNAATTPLPGNLRAADSNRKQAVSKAQEEGAKAVARHGRFELGIKAGYEGGWDNVSATKLVLSPYLQYNLNQKWSILTQPAIKSASVRSQTGSPASYYQVNNDGKTVQSGPSVAHKAVLGPGDTVTDYYATPFTYTQTHDSVVKTTQYGGNYLELELPLLLQYRLSHNLRVYGGVNVVYHQFNPYQVRTYTRKNIVRSVSESDTTGPTQAIVPPTDLSFTYSGNPLSSYRSMQTSSSAQLLAGYMIGFSYEYGKRWMADALIQQTPTVLTGGQMTAPFSGASYRFSIGYKLTK